MISTDTVGVRHAILECEKALNGLNQQQWREALCGILRLQRKRLERGIPLGWDAALSLELDRLLAAEEALGDR